VTRVFEHEGRPAVELDRSAFYPTSGGQLFDTGRLGGSDVVDVVDLEETIAHVLTAPLEPGTRVSGVIDWSRRFDHMQQHTGQHVLSAAFDRLVGRRTVSVHFGADSSTIDLGEEVSPADVERAVDEANSVVWADRPVHVRFASDAEAASLGLRKPSAREGTLRLIDVEGFDLSACGGTHVSRTGAIGVIVSTGAERFKGGSRVSFVCGARAVRFFRTYRDAVSGSIRWLSVLPSELPAAIERVQTESKEIRRLLKSAHGALAGHEADHLLSSAPDDEGARLVTHVLEGWDASGLKAIASALTRHAAVRAVLVSSPPPAAVVVARSADAPGDAAAVLEALTARFGGRGGGRAELAQGGGLMGSPAEIAAEGGRLFR
jgi:alanyl-tRNA synthetase